ncbi:MULTISPECIES: hypothetical protein [unclassified Sinorhizobium]|uniref:hypothetical protein n=1 Tax=unclassified Sinorhizobium TaxID=2613772 RepID=UPI0024C3F077|nr:MULTISPECIES: hypothetical protein [unclassified Sinorhizobium]MDK1377359.1 hypothetical protein [Sinorhizobium sp. 6-70]MDK1478849.1 hypothetical protein [Sinorhizobium sp. 6-117]
MLLQWTILYRELVGQQRKKRSDAFADPLDGAEWEGFGWLVKWIETSAARRSQADHKGLLGAASRARHPQPCGHPANRSISNCSP